MSLLLLFGGQGIPPIIHPAPSIAFPTVATARTYTSAATVTMISTLVRPATRATITPKLGSATVSM